MLEPKSTDIAGTGVMDSFEEVSILYWGIFVRTLSPIWDASSIAQTIHLTMQTTKYKQGEGCWSNDLMTRHNL